MDQPSAYTTSADCVMTVTSKGRTVSHRSRLVGISSDGARVLCEQSLATGSVLSLSIEGFNVPPFPVRVQVNRGDVGSGYDLDLLLVEGSWPFEVFSKLAMAAYASRGAAAPPCLEVLELTLPCSRRDVEDAYYQKVRLAHPDKGGNVEAFVRLRSAYLEALKLASR